jgi:ribosomal protein L11 methyltransferase
MRWIEFSVQVDGESVEAVSDLFTRHVQSGVAIEELEPPGELLVGPQTLRTDRPVKVSAYAPEDGRVEEVRRKLSEGIRYLTMIRAMGPLQERAVAEEEWATAWKEHFHVHRPGERTVVVPTWREYAPQEGDIVVRLDPGMAFGTGLHPTTRLCVREVERWVKPGMTVLDVGTGSGILALVAAGLDASRVLGVDIDPVAVRAAQENVAANGRAGVIKVREGSLPRRDEGLPQGWPEGGFDIVVANMTAETLADLADRLRDAMRPGGMLIGSGIIGDKLTEAVYALMGAGLRLADALSEGDWRAVVMLRLEGT